MKVSATLLVAALAIVILALAPIGASHAETPAAPAAAPSKAPDAAAKPTGPVAPEAMNGISFEGLTDAQKKLAASILNENGCDCGCGMKVAVCRRDDATCGRSRALATQVIDLVKTGKTREEVVKIALTPPTKFVQFPLSPGEAPAVGPAGAKVTVLFYFDYQCPFCARVSPTIEQIVKEYPKDVRVVYKQHPLPMHQNAAIAAQASLAAKAQGKFLEMHLKLFENSSSLSRDKVIALAKEIGLDADKFAKDLDSESIKAVVAKEAKEAEDIGASGTPAAFINGRYVNGAKPFSAFKEVIDEELAWAKAGNRPSFKTGKNVSEASVQQASAPQGPDPNKVYEIALAGAPVVGSSKAKVTVVHYFDYQCPYCVQVHATLVKLLQDYPDDVRIAYKMHPLDFHPQAGIAAEAAMAADAQGKFRQMHEKLFENAGKVTREKIMEIAGQIGLDVPRFTKDFDANAHKAKISAQTDEAMKLGASGTPASFVNGRYLPGAQPYEAFKKVVDEELAKTKSAKASG